MMNARGQFRRELLPPPHVYYEAALGKLSRPSRGWAHGNCPFHQSQSKKSFSVNIDSGGFYCFGCHAKGGDIIDFVRLRDELDFKTAAKRLGAWDEAGVVSPEQARALQRELARKRAQQLAQQEAEARRRIEARDWLHLLERFYKESNDRLSQLQQGATEDFVGETERHWDILALGLDAIRRAEAEYCQIAGLDQ